MKNFLWITFLTITACVNAQNGGKISGKITDIGLGDEPLLMANVTIKNTDIATQTNLNGNFEILGIDPGMYVLTLSFAGYDTVEIPVNVLAETTTKIEQGLSPKNIQWDASMLDEVEYQRRGGLTAEAEK